MQLNTTPPGKTLQSEGDLGTQGLRLLKKNCTDPVQELCLCRQGANLVATGCPGAPVLHGEELSGKVSVPFCCPPNCPMEKYPFRNLVENCVSHADIFPRQHPRRGRATKRKDPGSQTLPAFPWITYAKTTASKSSGRLLSHLNQCYLGLTDSSSKLSQESISSFKLLKFVSP